MVTTIWRKFFPHLTAIVIFLFIAFIYMSPALEGKLINQTDVTKAMGQQSEIAKYHKETGDYSLWTNSMFSGMPVYQISMTGIPNYNIFHHLSSYIRFGFPTYSVDILFLYLLGFYLLLLMLRVSPWISIIGAIAFALSSYNIIYIEAGHVNKALAIAMIPPALSGVMLILRKKYLFGGLLFCLFLGIQLAYNHFQMTYYLFLIIMVIGIVELVYALREKQIKHLLISFSIIIVATIFSILPNLTNIVTTYEYSKESMRGGSELTKYEEETTNESSGLDINYAMAWSYGKAETFTLLIPNFKGGPSVGELSTSSVLYENLIKNGVPKSQAGKLIKQVYTYWGGKSITAGPFYFGAVICFLFVLGLFLIKGKTKWWIISISLLAILWSWGENFAGFYSLFFKYFPLFDKFRVPENFLVIPSLTFPVLGILAIKQLFSDDVTLEDKKKAVLRSFYIVGGLSLFFVLFGKGMFNFVSERDNMLQAQQFPAWFIESLQEDRAQLLRADAFRSFIFISLTFGLIWFHNNKKINVKYFIPILGFLILIDLWAVDKRYLNADNFSSKKAARAITPTRANLEILKDPDPHYRVFNFTQGPFQESHTSYFHKSIGGYHAAKLSRYQDLIEHHLSKQNMNVINMLNTKYLIVPDQQSAEPLNYYNQDACGNAWFVDSIKFVDNPNEEIEALTDFDPKREAIIDKKYKLYFKDFKYPDSTGTANIQLTSYKPDELEYISKNENSGLAVFSEIYYNSGKGWKAYIDDEFVPHIRVNYVLRALMIPEGEHQIRFKFESPAFNKAQKVSLSASFLIGLLVILSISGSIWKAKKSGAFSENLSDQAEKN